MSADAYILEKIEFAKNPREFIVVTDDRALSKEAKHLGALILSLSSFFKELNKKRASKEQEKKKTRETPREQLRWLKIFEKKLDDDTV